MPLKKQSKIRVRQKRSNRMEEKQPMLQKEHMEDLLVEFDWDMQFGPHLDITRMQRWRRADRFGLNPPKKVYDLLMSDTKYNCYPKIIERRGQGSS